MDSGGFHAGRRKAGKTLELLARFDAVFDVLWGSRVCSKGPFPTRKWIAMIAERAAGPRNHSDFARADQVRDQLADRGITLEDTRDGVRWKRR